MPHGHMLSSEIVSYNAGKILVGHDLSGDLRMLNVAHPCNLQRDTYRCSFFRINNDCRRSLKHLTKVYLEEDIQCGSGRHSAL